MNRKDGLDRLSQVIKKGFVCRKVEVNRYVEVGDWGEKYVSVVPHMDSRSEAGVLIHEIVEKLLCDYYGISAEEVDKDDAAILKGKLRHNQTCYWKCHLVALEIEKRFVEAMHMDWEEHGLNVEIAYSQQEGLLN